MGVTQNWLLRGHKIRWLCLVDKVKDFYWLSRGGHESVSSSPCCRCALIGWWEEDTGSCVFLSPTKHTLDKNPVSGVSTCVSSAFGFDLIGWWEDVLQCDPLSNQPEHSCSEVTHVVLLTANCVLLWAANLGTGRYRILCPPVLWLADQRRTQDLSSQQPIWPLGQPGEIDVEVTLSWWMTEPPSPNTVGRWILFSGEHMIDWPVEV